MVDFGVRLKTLRLRKNMTQAQLAEKLELTKSVVSAYETGIRLPSYDNMINISRMFKVSTDYLLGVENDSLLDFSVLSKEQAEALINLVNAMKKEL